MSPRVFLSAFILLASTFCFSQDDLSLNFLKRTSLAVHNAQKQMKANGKTDMGGQLAKAVLLQSYAVKLRENKKNKEAVCVSAEARQFALGIIKELTGRENGLTVTDDERVLVQNCASQEEMLTESKKEMKNISDKDQDYMPHASLNSTNIDIK